MSSQNPRFNFVNDQNEVVGSDANIGKAIPSASASREPSSLLPRTARYLGKS
ncbi:hypothetical protein [Mesorhizobium sp.]|uniref:hypothetical protein n=1 Tax=Mesorhizobium sp. TaxID=1871066 RepID=UPI00257AE2EE|nr:hypothetical protein [Mesorhizobium sp.]